MPDSNPSRPPGSAPAAGQEFVPQRFTQVSQALTRGLGLYLSCWPTVAALVLLLHAPVQLCKQYALFRGWFPEDSELWLGMGVSSLLTPLLVPAVIYVLAERQRTGLAIELGDALRYGLSCWGRIFIANLLAGVLIVAGLFCFVVPGIIFSIWFIFVEEIIAVEGAQVQGVLRRSREITEGYRPLIFKTLLLLGIGVFLVAAFFGGLASATSSWVAVAAIDSCLGLLEPVFIAVGLAMYVDIVHGQQGRTDWCAQLPWVGPDSPRS